MPSNVVVIVPNLTLLSEKVTNWSLESPRVRVEISINVAQGPEPQLVRETLLKVAGASGLVLRRPPAEVLLDAYGDATITFKLLVWIAEPLRVRHIKSELILAAITALQSARMDISEDMREKRAREAQAG